MGGLPGSHIEIAVSSPVFSLLDGGDPGANPIEWDTDSTLIWNGYGWISIDPHLRMEGQACMFWR